MRQEILKWRDRVGLGIIASVALHLTVGTALLVNLPFDLPQPEPEESVAVELVPPPEEEKPEETAPEPPKEEAKKEAATPEAPPPSAAEEKPDEAAKPEPVPEPPPAAEPPPASPLPQVPPPSAQQEEPKAEPPKGPAQPQQQAEAGGPDADAATPNAQGPVIPQLKPVFEFGEKDSGPRKEDAGSSATDDPPSAEEAEEDPSADQKMAALEAEQATAEATAPTERPVASQAAEAGTDAVPGAPIPAGVEAPKVDFGPVSPNQYGANGAADDGKAGVLVTPTPKPGAKQPTEGLPSETVRLRKAKTLFSQNETADLRGVTAMAGLSPARRGTKLCMSELQAQLRHMTPRYSVDAVPQVAMPASGVQMVEKAFLAQGKWYRLHYRCEVDAKVTKVVSFAHNVGPVIPRDEWTAEMIRTWNAIY